MAIRGANRRLFARSPSVIEKLEESRQEFPRYKKDGSRAKKNWVKRQCEVCETWVSSTKISVDHIDPVVPPDGFPAHFDMWDRLFLFLRRLWCDKANLQRICDDCHDSKTYAERISRLNAQYSKELDDLEMEIGALVVSTLAKASVSSYKKKINKYISKKKTKGLELVVQRALRLREIINGR